MSEERQEEEPEFIQHNYVDKRSKELVVGTLLAKDKDGNWLTSNPQFNSNGTLNFIVEPPPSQKNDRDQ